MSQYSPNFSRNPKGKFNPELGFLSVKGGTNAYLLEDELNELQWIQNEARAEIVRKLTNSGCMQVENFNNNNIIKGGLKELLYNNLNSFLLYGFDAILNGYLAYIDNNNLNGNIITLPNPPQNGTRYDFVYLEFWFNEIKQYDDIKKYGGIGNSNETYEIIDTRPSINVETSRRTQLQWNIRIVPDVDHNIYPLGFISENSNSNFNINPVCNTGIEQTEFAFRNCTNDVNLFIAGNGTEYDKNILQTIDGCCYAIPLFFIKRLNTNGYDAINNPNGAINYIDNNSVSDRLDGKFSNIIYDSDIIDVRPLAIMGSIQLNNVYTSKTQFEQLLTTVNNISQRLSIMEYQLEKLGINLTFTNLIYYGTNIEFDNILSAGGQIQLDGTINSEGVIINSQFQGYNNYSIMYSAKSLMIGKIGDVWLEKADTAAVFKNSGYDNINIDVSIIKNDNAAVIGSGIFNSMDGVEIRHHLLETDFLFITPTSDTYGTIGEIYYEVSQNGFIVYNTGFAGTTFDYIIMDTTQLRNVVLTEISYNGTTTITGGYGTHFNAFIGPCNIPINNGSIGDVSIATSLNTLTVYNTGTSDDGITVAKCLIFKEYINE